MALKGKKIISKASGLTGRISGIEKSSLKVTFTGFQDVTIPLSKAEAFLMMDEETLNELHSDTAYRKAFKDNRKESKVETYMDHFEEEVEVIEEQAPVQMEFDDID